MSIPAAVTDMVERIWQSIQKLPRELQLELANRILSQSGQSMPSPESRKGIADSLSGLLKEAGPLSDEAVRDLVADEIFKKYS